MLAELCEDGVVNLVSFVHHIPIDGACYTDAGQALYAWMSSTRLGVPCLVSCVIMAEFIFRVCGRGCLEDNVFLE